MTAKTPKPEHQTSPVFRKVVAATSLVNKRYFLLLVVLTSVAISAAAEFTIGPYIQNPGTTTMTVMWESVLNDP